MPPVFEIDVEIFLSVNEKCHFVSKNVFQKAIELSVINNLEARHSKRLLYCSDQNFDSKRSYTILQDIINIVEQALFGDLRGSF